MVRGIIEPSSIRRIKDSMELQDATSQISVGVNIIVTMFTCFVLGWFLGWKAFGDQVLVWQFPSHSYFPPYLRTEFRLFVQA